MAFVRLWRLFSISLVLTSCRQTQRPLPALFASYPFYFFQPFLLPHNSNKPIFNLTISSSKKSQTTREKARNHLPKISLYTLYFFISLIIHNNKTAYIAVTQGVTIKLYCHIQLFQLMINLDWIASAIWGNQYDRRETERA